jgi:ribosomal-protein-alanine N-acetyltransferase
MAEKTRVDVREVGPTDYENLARFFEENNLGVVTRHFHPFPLTPRSAETIACASHRDRYYVASQVDRVVGFSMLRGWDEGYAIPSFGILIDHRFHRRGIGRQLLEYTLDEARKLASSRVRLSVYASNHAALHLYESEGFVEGVREQVLVAGEPDEKIVMFRDL